MCTYITETLAVSGSAKVGTEWQKVSATSVYFDHPVHAPYDHSLNIDIFDANDDKARRVALELSEESARTLANSILAILDTSAAELAHAH